MRRRLRTVFLLGMVIGIVAALARARTRPTTAIEARPSPPPAAADPGPGTPTRPATAAGTEPEAEDEPETEDEPSSSTGVGTRWAAPVDGACPDGFPIKAKESSGIFHVPGGLSYDRTNPDRCYPDPATAEADGFRAAKR